MTKKILITGASGLIGARLTSRLLDKGYQVAHLGRSKKSGEVQSFVWNPAKGTFDAEAMNGVDVVINLAGAGVADKRWTAKRKQMILDSRIDSVNLLAEMVKDSTVETVIGASAIGYYGMSTDQESFEESHAPGSDFLSQVTHAWEKTYTQIEDQGKRLVNLRIGIVLAKEGGALQAIVKPIRYFAGAPLGDGKQMLSWIHIEDLCEMFLYAIENKHVNGVYNAVSPNPVSNKQITKTVAKEIKRPILLPFVPAFALKMVLGEMASIVLGGSVVSSKKIEASGFNFSFSEIEEALHDLLGPRT